MVENIQLLMEHIFSITIVQFIWCALFWGLFRDFVLITLIRFDICSKIILNYGQKRLFNLVNQSPRSWIIDCNTREIRSFDEDK